MSGVVRLFEKYVDVGVCGFLSDWCLENRDQFVDGWSMVDGVLRRSGARISNRMSSNICYHDLFYELQARIGRDLGLEGYKVVEGHGKDGMVVSIAFDGGGVYEHVDPGVGVGLHALRFNVLLSEPDSGGVVSVAGVPYTLRVGDAMAYLVTKHSHSVSVCYGKPRILAMFGWCVPEGFWEPEL